MSEPELIARAIGLHRAGYLDEAAELYDRILQTQPDHLDALHLLGVIAYQHGEYTRAVQLIRKAIALDDSQALPHNHLGLALSRQGMLEEAAASFDRAQTQDPAFAPAHSNLGTVRLWQKRPADAEACFRRALAVDPEYAEAHHNLGVVRRLADDPGGAAECFRNAIATNPSYIDALASLGEVLLLLGQPSEAIPYFQKALAVAPASATAHCGLGDALYASGEVVEAITAYQQAASLDPTYLKPWWNIGCAQTAMGEYVAAASSFRRVAEIAPDYGDAHNSLGKVLFESGHIDQALDAFRTATTLLQDPELPLGSIATIIPGSSRANDGTIRDARQAWAKCAGLADLPAGAFPRPFGRSDRRLRVGYVSAYFQARNWMKPVFGLINRHDRGRFEIHLFSDAPEARVQHGYRKHPQDRFHDISGLSNEEAARLIEERGIDVLVDLNGYSRLARLPLLGLRPAPVVIAWFNMYAPSGLGCIDYLIGDEHVIPPQDEAFYSERIIRIPGCYLTFEVDYPVPEVGPAPCLSRGGITFGCLAPQYKITPEAIEAWSRILRACPGSRLMLKSHFLSSPENCRFVHDLFARSAVGSGRVELDGPAEHYDFLAKYNEVDIALDTFPYNGGTTTMEALWQGVPVVTYYGDRWVSRISASLLRNAGLSEFVAPDPDGYVNHAIELANSPEVTTKLDTLRRTMRDRVRRAPVCDTRGFARAMEREYLSMAGMAHP